MRLLFVGQAPSQDSDGQPPFTGKCGKFLAETLLNTTQEQMLLDHDFMNVFDRWPGKGINGDKFPMREAKDRVPYLVEKLRDRVVVMLGHNVATAFGAKGFTYLTWYEIRNPKNVNDVIVPKMVVVPHPSGINRYWNVPSNRLIASKFLIETIKHKEN
jgi:uracil-DNA glycosylase